MQCYGSLRGLPRRPAWILWAHAVVTEAGGVLGRTLVYYRSVLALFNVGKVQRRLFVVTVLVNLCS